MNMEINRRSYLLTSLAAVPGIRLARAAATSLSAATMTGKVRGYSFDGVAIFRGIPYGGPTEGKARFLPPSKPLPWTAERDCTANGPRCVQGPANLFRNPVIGEYFGGGRPDRIQLSEQTDSENCLNLNVLTPSLQGKRPVMVYIHGGGFSQGSDVLTVFGDRHVREEDVVLVGVNHRINVFGYTYLGGLSDKYEVGNPGQLDLVAALEWVRDNVGNFGGDPANVTIFGESGGGGKISALMAMPAAKGLFHKAIIESGSQLSVASAADATEKAKTLLGKLGVSNPEELQDIPAAKLFEAAASLEAGGAGPVIDGHSIPKQTWEPTAPEVSATVPMIIGSCKDETALFTLQNTRLYSLDATGLQTALIKGGVPQEKVELVISLYRRDYPKDSPSDLYFRIAADRAVRNRAVAQSERKVAQGNANVYMYHFEWNTPCGEGKVRAFHTAELPLVMRLTMYPESEQLSKQLSGAWASFARTGNPSQNGLVWPAYTASTRATMIFDASRSGAKNDPDRDERIMLNDLPPGSMR
jgi:para-nitrobenzyl esterase